MPAPNQIPSKSLSNEIYAYMAGMIDGEGSFLVKKIGSTLQTRITVANTDKNVIDWMKETFGGCVWQQSVSGNRKPSYHYEMAGYAMRFHLLRLYPYFKIKKAHASLSLEFLKTIRPKNTLRLSESVKDKRNKIKSEMSILNKRGI